MCARVGGCYCNSILCARVRVRRVCEKGKNRKKGATVREGVIEPSFCPLRFHISNQR